MISFSMTQDKTRLIPFISQDRLAPYVAATGNLDAAFEMYVHNQMISSALYIPLQNLEVGLRNRVFHRAYSSAWTTLRNP